MATLLLACSKKNENQPACQPLKVSMVVNGDLQTFEVLGYGIDLTSKGHVLHLNLDRREYTPLREQTVFMTLPYKKTGKNVIDEFFYRQYINKVTFQGSFLEGEFESNVVTNNKYCIYATFSGKLSDGNQEVIITDGVVSYSYDTPFEN